MPLKARLKVLVLNPFPVYPPVSGGQGRVFHLYKHVAHYFDVVILCFSDRRSYKMIAPGLQQIQIPKSSSHCRMELELFRKAGFATCAVVPKTASLTPEYGHMVKKLAKEADIAILSHPYLWEEVQDLGDNCIIVYDAHNAEFDLHRQILPASLSFLLEDVRQAEAAACGQSQIIATCSQEDADKLACFYNIAREKFVSVPNGADVAAIPFVCREQRQRNKAVRNMVQPRAVYMGSNFPPNIRAAGRVIELAKELPGVNFSLMGSLCKGFAGRTLPGNVALLGVVTEQEKHCVFGLADMALNPAESGSGTHLKMLEYMAAGLPVITTPLGSRGLGGTDGQHFLVSEGTGMAARIRELLGNPLLADSLAHQAYMLVTARFDWQRIAAGFADRLSAVCESRAR